MPYSHADSREIAAPSSPAATQNTRFMVCAVRLPGTIARRFSCWATNFSFLLGLWASCLPTKSLIKNNKLRFVQDKQNFRVTYPKASWNSFFFSPACLVFTVIRQKETSAILHTKGIIEWHREMSLFSNNFMYRTMFVSEW